MKWMLCAAVALGASCQPDDFVAGPGPEAAPLGPNAHSGTGTTVRVGSTVTLDASASFDLDGVVSTYHWVTSAAPPGSGAQPVEPDRMTTTVTLDVAGSYLFNLSVVDDEGNADSESVVFRAEAPRVSVDAGPDVNVPWRSVVQLHGSYSLEVPASVLVYWRFVSMPEGAAPHLDDTSSLMPTFEANEVGDYVLEMSVQAGDQNRVDAVRVHVEPEVETLPMDLVAIEWSDALDRFVLLDQIALAVLLLDPVTGATESIPLPAGAGPSDLALDPSGTRAAIPREDELEIVDLVAGAVVDTYDTVVTPATNATFEAVFGPNERVHLFRRSVTDWVRTVDLVTSAVTSSATQFPSPNGAAARAGTTEVYSYNDTTITQWNGSAAPLAPVRSTAFGQLGNVYFSPAGTFAISSFADLIDLDALVSNIDILNDFIVHAAAHAPALHELAFVGTPRSSPGPYFLVVMTDQLGPPFYIGLPEAVPQPQAVSVAINDAGSQVYIVLRGAAGNTVLLTVPL